MIERRTFLRTASAIAIGSALAGCSGEQDDDEQDANGSSDDADGSGDGDVTEVDVGPEGRLRYEPEEVEIEVGDTVRWTALSEGHNVTSHPDASPKCENPDDADPFTSYEGDDHFAIMDVDETFEHEFAVPGEYVYVCTPHAGQGMVGTVIVTE
ncbi:plastocyanin/azurin family copper-binding protein [Halosolutus halophilus]|uniref:plastocyanin/azurin family copper-binding protein n=1 Tax=Halosolutus halophilus TaxID=1552990 RepID=UPI0022351D24|nr:plastocyanin/azurin family copper-binding protein [Halosolutus halophilus]